MRILVVDDKEENLYLLRSLLEGHGFGVEAARHGAEALVLARREPPDLVISDLLMPVMDGYTLLRHWRSERGLRSVPFVVYTATYTEPEDERLALDLGADAFVLKPAEPGPFLERLRSILVQARRGELAPVRFPAGDEAETLREYSSVLVRKLEQKAFELEAANRALREDIARREAAEADAARLLGEAERGRRALLGILEDERAADHARRETETRLRLVVAGTDTGLWDWNLATDEVRYSHEWKRQLGYEDLEVADHLDEWRRLTHPDDLEPTLARVAAFLAQPEGMLETEFRMFHKTGEPRWILSRATLVRGADGQADRLVGLHVDITERRRAEEALRRSEQKFEVLFEKAPFPLVLTLVPDGAITAVNQAFEQAFGWSRSEVVGRSSQALGIFPPATRARLISEAQAHGSVQDEELELCGRAGERLVMLVSSEEIQIGDAPFILTAARDITARKQAEEERRALPGRLLAAQEDVQRRLAAELHDELGQLLTAVKLQLRAAAKATAAVNLEALAAAREAVDRAVAGLRRISLDLRPQVLDDLGLAPALRWLADRVSRDSGIDVRLASELEERYASPVETVCFRVAQEALTNVARHSEAERAWIELRRAGPRLHLEVRDDGRGFDVGAALAEARAGGSLGLPGMRERVELLGGELRIDSRPGGGCAIIATVPLPPGGDAGSPPAEPV